MVHSTMELGWRNAIWNCTTHYNGTTHYGWRNGLWNYNGATQYGIAQPIMEL
ncbi:hypothetical protein [Flavobacterium reichenbachii]|uniref:hypothetical protein n=1 Tax=Flavobacterium reichenbachii TaxID=362418 RepID=UPI0013F47EB6|nr:hypothetical protein [Flavobacterium reichenbachii]